MVRLYVARHGQDGDNARGILNGQRDQPLTELGRQQARDVAQKMVDAGFTLAVTASSQSSSGLAKSMTSLSAIYSSPLQRAHETAKIFAEILSNANDNDETPSSAPISTDTSNNKQCNTKVEILNGLIERDFGIMTGLPASSILEKCGSDHVLVTEKINYFLDPTGAETFPDLIGRAKKLLSHIQQITSTYDADDAILLVTHGDFGKMLYASYYDMDWEEVLKQFHFGNSEVLLLSKDSPPEKAHVFETIQFNA